MKTLIYLSTFGALIYFLFFHTTSREIPYESGSASKAAARFETSIPGGQVDDAPLESQVLDSVVLEDEYELSELSAVSKKITPAVVTGGGYKAFTLANTVESRQIEKQLMRHGMKKRYARAYSPRIGKLLSSKAFKRVTILVTTAGFVMTIEEFLFEKLTFKERILIAAGFGILILLLYIRSVNKGVMN